MYKRVFLIISVLIGCLDEFNSIITQAIHMDALFQDIVGEFQFLTNMTGMKVPSTGLLRDDITNLLPGPCEVADVHPDLKNTRKIEETSTVGKLCCLPQNARCLRILALPKADLDSMWMPPSNMEPGQGLVMTGKKKISNQEA